jgi:hypothetical protein
MFVPDILCSYSFYSPPFCWLFLPLCARSIRPESLSCSFCSWSTSSRYLPLREPADPLLSIGPPPRGIRGSQRAATEVAAEDLLLIKDSAGGSSKADTPLAGKRPGAAVVECGEWNLWIPWRRFSADDCDMGRLSQDP